MSPGGSRRELGLRGGGGPYTAMGSGVTPNQAASVIRMS